LETIRLVIAYEGTRYHGWQVQPNQTTIQAVLQDAYAQMTGAETQMLAAGRTDAGVHAAAQVVCFENNSRHEPQVLREGLNRFLPKDIVIKKAEIAPAGFDPRRQAVGKHYRYVIHNARVRPLFERNFRWHVRAELNLQSMNKAAACLIGEHDFSAFRASGCEAKHAVRTIDRIDWSSEESTVKLDIWGRGFLKQMVRNLAGTFVEIGRGRWSIDDMQIILESRNRERAGPTAPACGLCLVRVYYDKEEYRAAPPGSAT